MKMPPTILDSWQPTPAEKRYFSATVKAIQNDFYNVRRFVFDTEVCRMMGNLLRDDPNVFIDNLQFALPPYEKTYIEIDLDTFLDGLGTGERSRELQTQTDTKVGYFIVGNYVYTLVKAKTGYTPDACVAPLIYAMNFIQPAQNRLRGLRPIIFRDGNNPTTDNDDTVELRKGWTKENTSDINEDWNLAQILGTTLLNPKLTLTPEVAHSLQRNYVCMRDEEQVFNNNEAIREVLEGSVGDVRNILVSLLWLNQPKLVTQTFVPASRGWHKSKPKAYSAYNVVSIKHNMTVTRAAKVFRDRTPPRRHEVAGHWRNFDKHDGCSHDWPIYPDLQGQWKCQKCGQRRVRVREHLRGDASIGFVSKDYKVER